MDDSDDPAYLDADVWEAHRDALRALALEHGLAGVELAHSGELVVTVEGSGSSETVDQFLLAVEATIGARRATMVQGRGRVPLTDDERDLLMGLADDARGQAGGLSPDDQVRLAELSLRAWSEIEHLRLVVEVADLVHWGVDALWSTLRDPALWPVDLDPLFAYGHRVINHGEIPTRARIEELRRLLDRAYDQQRPGLALDDTSVDWRTDLGTLDDDGLVWARRDAFEPSTDVQVGAQLTIGDPEDAVWRATVVQIEDRWVSLRLDYLVD